MIVSQSYLSGTSFETVSRQVPVPSGVGSRFSPLVISLLMVII